MTPARSTPSSFLLCAGLVAIVLGLLYEGLKPFDFLRPNGSTWAADGSGLLFRGGISYSSGALDLGRSIREETISIEIWIEAEARSRYGLATILALFDSRGNEVLSIGQSKSSMILRGLLAPSEEKRFWQHARSRLFLPGERYFIAITSSAEEGTVMYANGERTGRPSHHALMAGAQADGLRLVVGASPDGRKPWAGKISGLAIFDRVLTADEIGRHWQRVRQGGVRELIEFPGLVACYPLEEGLGSRARNIVSRDFRSHLEFPRTFVPARRSELLKWRGFGRALNIRDALRNVLGFVPFGFLLACVLRKYLAASAMSSLVVTILLGTIFSLSIEYVQIFLPSRYSGIVDLIMNSFGTMLGASLAFLIWRIR